MPHPSSVNVSRRRLLEAGAVVLGALALPQVAPRGRGF
ncbi:hypothetical protein GA0115252_13861, partial [Streptomyces sp. DfronAA-171]